MSAKHLRRSGRASIAIHPTADVSPHASIGAGTRIWNEAQIREGAIIGPDCRIAKGVYIDRDVVIGERVKIQNRASLFRGVTVEDGVFIGPHVTFTNDLYPRAIHPDGRVVTDEDWQPLPTLVRRGASIGAAAVILCGITIGRWAMVAAGALVSRDVPDHALVMGQPARFTGYICACGRRLQERPETWDCTACGRTYRLQMAGGVHTLNEVL
jgi:acetyltransferase-like isoleucine patch superfamily enzyme